MKAVLSPNPYRDRGLKTSKAAQRILEEHGIRTAICLPFELDENSRLDIPSSVKLTSLAEELNGADFLICFGGDGTILHAARDANLRKIPILGINMGSVGFMAELEHSELHHLSKLAAGDYTIESRMMLDVRVYRDEKEIARDVALNDAVVTKGAVARVLDLEITGDGVTMSTFGGDGVIVSTPTGSTAYAMSAGGPIVEPTTQNIILTPICAHDMQTKTIVTAPERKITVEVGRIGRKNAFLSVDGGRALRLNTGDVVRIARSKYTTRLVHLSERNFFDIVKNKFK